MLDRLTSLKPFLFNAYYNWLVENEITPHVLVDATVNGVKVPQAYVRNGAIMLSIRPDAISEYQALARGISFKARFSGVSEDIYIPYKAMQQLVCIESNTAFPIGIMLEQLDLAGDDDEIYPDEGVKQEQPLFEFDDSSEKIEPTKDDDKAGASTKENSDSEPAFTFVKDDQ